MNGIALAELQGQNLGVRNEQGLTEYSFHYRRFGKMGYPPSAARGTLWHRRQAGLERLVAAILQRVAEENAPGPVIPQPRTAPE